MKIQGVVICCYALDVYMTRICVASIRFWYPDLPIWLLKDRQYGDFSTREIEDKFNVQVYPVRLEKLGWGFGKLEPLTELPHRRLLILDSDVVFVGRVIDRLELFDEDLIVENSSVENSDEPTVEEQFFSLQGLRQFDPSFSFPGYGFNTGQIVATTGKLTKKSMEGLVDWQKPSVMRPDIFKKGEQGLLNYVALREVQRGNLTIRREPFMVWPGVPSRAEHIRLEDINSEGKHQQLIHWAGLRWGKTIEEMPKPEILRFFETIYYKEMSFGTLRRQWRKAQFVAARNWITPLKLLIKEALNQLPRRHGQQKPSSN
jgi:hypothetical protein